MPHAPMHRDFMPDTGFVPDYTNLMLAADRTCDKCAYWDGDCLPGNGTGGRGDDRENNWTDRKRNRANDRAGDAKETNTGGIIRAIINGRSVRVAQCLRATLDDAAPYAEVTGPEAAVFTQGASGCAAFELHADERLGLETLAGELT